jgi:hypothetical protein
MRFSWLWILVLVKEERMQWIKPAKLFLLVAAVAFVIMPFAAEAS